MAFRRNPASPVRRQDRRLRRRRPDERQRIPSPLQATGERSTPLTADGLALKAGGPGTVFSDFRHDLDRSSGRGRDETSGTADDCGRTPVGTCFGFNRADLAITFGAPGFYRASRRPARPRRFGRAASRRARRDWWVLGLAVEPCRPRVLDRRHVRGPATAMALHRRGALSETARRDRAFVPASEGLSSPLHPVREARRDAPRLHSFRFHHRCIAL